MRKMTLIILLLGTVQAWPGTIPGLPEAPADTLRLSLQTAVLTALERNPNMAIERLNPLIAKSSARMQAAAFDPSLTFVMTKDKSKTQRFLGSRPEPFELTSERTQYDLGILEALPTGTSFSIDASIIESLSSIYTAQYSGNIGLTITQSLLRGLSVGANMASLRKAKIDLEISWSELKAMAENLVAETETAYWEVYLAHEEIRIQEESLRLANKQMNESLERVAVGKLPELELAAVRAEVAMRKGALIDAQSRYEQARLNLLFLLNPVEENVWNIVPLPTDRPSISSDSLDVLTVHETLAMKYRPDLIQTRLDLKKGQIEVVRTRNGLLPQLDFFITMGRTTYSKTFTDAIPEIDSPFYNINAGVNFEFPIPNRSASAQYASAKGSREQLEYALQNMERLAQRDIRSAYIETMRTRQQIEATAETRILMEKNLEAELEKFRVGKSTNLLVLQVQRDFTAAQLDEIRATVDYIGALVNLHLMEGTLLERRGIEVPSAF